MKSSLAMLLLVTLATSDDRDRFGQSYEVRPTRWQSAGFDVPILYRAFYHGPDYKPLRGKWIKEHGKYVLLVHISDDDLHTDDRLVVRAPDDDPAPIPQTIWPGRREGSIPHLRVITVNHLPHGRVSYKLAY